MKNNTLAPSMKQIFVVILSSILLLQSFSKLVIIANYELNKDYISKVLCENRNKPQMHCNGKCQLTKELAQDEKQQDSPANPLKEKNEVQICSYKESMFSFLPPLILVERNSFENSFISGKHLLSVFHPPTA